jgi:hypothetical protein
MMRPPGPGRIVAASWSTTVHHRRSDAMALADDIMRAALLAEG